MSASAAPTLTTARLVLAPMTLAAALFIVRLLNDPGFLRFIGDRKVRDEQQARAYLEKGPIDQHMNDVGHALLADALMEWFVARPLVPRPR
ncbi:MAG: hypothetical protein FJ293_12115 [Planctomycetes bacterium]|nr:hypothetical protein [Planctomycetota bacterium]